MHPHVMALQNIEKRLGTAPQSACISETEFKAIRHELLRLQIALHNQENELNKLHKELKRYKQEPCTSCTKKMTQFGDFDT